VLGLLPVVQCCHAYLDSVENMNIRRLCVSTGPAGAASMCWLLVVASLLLTVHQMTTSGDESRQPPRWLPVRAEVTSLRVIKAGFNQSGSAASDWWVQYELSYQVSGQVITNHMLVRHQSDTDRGFKTSQQTEYQLLQELNQAPSQVLLWVLASNPYQIR
jgi:hypothetical protein